MNAQPGQGGHFIIDGEGRRVRVESTEDHPEGNGPRPAAPPSAAEKSTTPANDTVGAAPSPRSETKKRS